WCVRCGGERKRAAMGAPTRRAAWTSPRAGDAMKHAARRAATQHAERWTHSATPGTIFLSRCCTTNQVNVKLQENMKTNENTPGKSTSSLLAASHFPLTRTPLPPSFLPPSHLLTFPSLPSYHPLTDFNPLVGFNPLSDFNAFTVFNSLTEFNLLIETLSLI
ncbi:unnamed protein product, partial [Closterium sp. NIES-53]